MAPTARTVQTELENVLSYLIGSEIALYMNPVKNDGRHVSWHTFDPDASFFASREARSTTNYRNWVETGAYSAILFDGALLQIAYEFAGHAVIGHRLAYVPCPFAFDVELLLVEPLVDLFDIYADGHTSEVVLDSVVRFDFDPVRAGPGHPASHLTINGSHCRIACAAPMRVGHFVDFVLRNFYPTIWSTHPFFARLPYGGFATRSITPDELEYTHLSWAV